MPVAEHDIDGELVRELLSRLPPALAHVSELPVHFVAEGWDNSVWRVGEHHVARVARRSLAASLLENEARWLHIAAAPLVARGIRVPSPIHLTPPGDLHPLPWLLTTWVDGVPLDDVPMVARTAALDPLVDALPALHRAAPADAPHNAFRATPISRLPAPAADIVRRARSVLGATAVDGLLDVLRRAEDAPPWQGGARWVHGDLHPLNLVLEGPTLGLLDFGDVTAGDPAVDLGVLWTAFDEGQRAAAIDGLAAHYDEDVWTRARGWAARLVLGVAGNDPTRFRHSLDHALGQLLAAPDAAPVDTGRDGSAVQPLHDPS